MRINVSLIILFLGFMHASADGFAQKINLSTKNVSLKNVFKSISQQTGYHFIYDTKELERVNVEVHVMNSSLSETMNIVLKDTDFSYKVVKNNVLLKKNKEGKGGAGSATHRVDVASAPVKEEQQQREISGTVADEHGQPLAGVSVKVKGTSLGTVTNASGAFFIAAPSSESVLVFSYIGFTPHEVKVGGQSKLAIVLKEDLASLSEVVVVGYGTQKRSETTGSISNVKGDAVAELPVQSFEGALNGLSTGVNMTASAGVLNQAPVFRIRGNNSLSLSSYPLIVVDGVPSFTSENDSGLGYAATNPLSAINPADIESIDIAKDAAATSIYGSRAANGVVFVTTKKGKRGKQKLPIKVGWVLLARIGFQRC